MDLAYISLEGLCAIISLVESAIVPLQSHLYLVVGLVVESLGLAAEMIKRYTSTIDFSSTNTTSKKCTGQAHQMLDLESHCRRKAEQLLVRGVGAVSVADALQRALDDAKAMFDRLSSGPKLVPQSPLLRRRVEVI